MLRVGKFLRNVPHLVAMEIEPAVLGVKRAGTQLTADLHYLVDRLFDKLVHHENDHTGDDQAYDQQYHDLNDHGEHQLMVFLRR